MIPAFASPLPHDPEEATPFHVFFFLLLPFFCFDYSFPSDCIILFVQNMHLHNFSHNKALITAGASRHKSYKEKY